MYLDFPGANSSPDEEPEDQQWPGWCQVIFFYLKRQWRELRLKALTGELHIKNMLFRLLIFIKN